MARKIQKRRTAKRTTAILLSITLTVPLLFLSGCANHHELNDVIVVQTVAVDFEDGNYIINAGYYTGESTGQDTQTSQAKLFTIKGSGENLLHAIIEAEFNTGKPLLFGECQAIIIGIGVLEKGIGEIMKVFSSTYETHPQVILAATTGKAEDILAVKYSDETVGTSKIKHIVDNASRMGELLPTRMYDVLKNITKKSNSVFLPNFVVEETGTELTEDGKEFFVKSGLIIKDERLYKEVDLTDVGGLAILTQKAKQTTISIDMDDQPSLVVSLYGIKVKVDPSFEDEKLRFHVKVKTNAEYIETAIKKDTIEQAPFVEELVSHAVLEILTETAQHCVNDVGADVINYERFVRHSDYRGWLKMEDDFGKYLETAEFTFDVKTKVNGYGLAW